jgi:glyoxylase-like metal-dependent hydrolase (beta-lactamase superfamily II)
MQQIERGIYYETSYLGVTLGGLVYSYGTIFIDAPLRPEDARSWRSTLLNQRGGANRLLINLDTHPDRTLGSRAMDCTIVAHQKAAQIFRNRPSIFKGQTIETGSAWEAYTDAVGMRWATPDVTFTDRLALHWGGPEVLVVYRPGPAPGASWVTIPAQKVVFVGDAVVVDQPPFLANGDLAAWLNTLDLLLGEYRDFTIVSGRGGLVSTEQVRDQRRFIEQVSGKLDKLAARNAPVAAVEALAPGLLSRLKSPAAEEERYLRRLRYGLVQFYNRHYRAIASIDQEVVEEQEE